MMSTHVLYGPVDHIAPARGNFDCRRMPDPLEGATVKFCTPTYLAETFFSPTPNIATSLVPFTNAIHHPHRQTINAMDRATELAARDLRRHWKDELLGLWDEPDPEGRVLSEGQRANLIHRCLKLWEKAPNWSTLLELNRRFLERDLPVCASFRSPPDRETDSFANILRLHNYGLLTTDSCRGWKTDLVRQRAYLYFNIPTQTPSSAVAHLYGFGKFIHRILPAPATSQSHALCQFIELLLAAPDIRAYIRFQYAAPSTEVRRDPAILALMRAGGGSRHSLPRQGDPEWEKEGWDLVEDPQGQGGGFSFIHQLKRSSVEQPWRYRPEIEMYGITEHGSEFHDNAKPILASWKADPLHICVVARKFRYRQIGQLIEQLLLEAGVNACF